MVSLKEKVLRLLKWSEQYTKTDMAYFASGGFWLGLGQSFASVSGLIVTIVFANLLPPETFGTYKFILAVGAIIAIPTLSGLNTALIRAIAQGRLGTLQATTRVKLRWGFIAFVFGICIAAYYFVNGDIVLARAIMIAAAFVPIMELGGLYSSVLLGKKAFEKSAWYDAALHGGTLVTLILVVLLTDNLSAILLAYFGSWTLGRLIALKRVITIYSNEDTSVSHESIALGKHLSIIGVINNIASNIDRIVLFQLLGPVSVAVYSVAISPVQRITGFVQLIKPLSIPRLAEQANHMTLKDYWRRLLYLEGALGGMCFVYIIAAPIFFALLFPDYPNAVIYSQVLALGMFGAATAFNSSVMIAMDARKQLYIQSSVGNSAQVILTFAGVYIFGVWGLVGAFLATRFIYLIIGTAQVALLLRRREHPLPSPQL